MIQVAGFSFLLGLMFHYMAYAFTWIISLVDSDFESDRCFFGPYYTDLGWVVTTNGFGCMIMISVMSFGLKIMISMISSSYILPSLRVFLQWRNSEYVVTILQSYCYFPWHLIFFQYVSDFHSLNFEYTKNIQILHGLAIYKVIKYWFPATLCMVWYVVLHSFLVAVTRRLRRKQSNS